jgi:hypothetical protein
MLANYVFSGQESFTALRFAVGCAPDSGLHRLRSKVAAMFATQIEMQKKSANSCRMDS